MAMTEFEKKMLQEVKGINKELHELNRTLNKEPVEGNSLSNAMEVAQRATVANMVSGTIKF